MASLRVRVPALVSPPSSVIKVWAKESGVWIEQNLVWVKQSGTWVVADPWLKQGGVWTE